MIKQVLYGVGDILFGDFIDAYDMAVDLYEGHRDAEDIRHFRQQFDMRDGEAGESLPEGSFAITSNGGLCMFTTVPLLYASVILTPKEDIDLLSVCLNIEGFLSNISIRGLLVPYNHSIYSLKNDGATMQTDGMLRDTKYDELKRSWYYELDMASIDGATLDHLKLGLSVQHTIEGSLIYLHRILEGILPAPCDKETVQEVFAILASCKDYCLLKYIYDVNNTEWYSVIYNAERILHLALKHIRFNRGYYEIDVESFFYAFTDNESFMKALSES